MPIESNVYNDGKYVISRISGVTTSEEIANMQFWLIGQNNDGNLKNDYRLLVDARGVEDLQLNESDIRRFTQVNGVFGRERGKLRTAIAIDTDAGRRLAELHKTLSKSVDIDVEVFESRQAACAWLEIDPDFEVAE